MNPLEFRAFDKIPRLSRDIVITEKLDGTNAQILIVPREEVPQSGIDFPAVPYMSAVLGGRDFLIVAGSRNRWISSASDNYGFGRWVSDNREELLKLGPGRHFGEWWGAGIQRRYNISEKRFSLFNVGRWFSSTDGKAQEILIPGNVASNVGTPIQCCHVVPVLYRGPFDEAQINTALGRLEMNGSAAAPGFMDPEGIVIYHEASKQCFKKTIKDDASPKGLSPNREFPIK